MISKERKYFLVSSSLAGGPVNSSNVDVVWDLKFFFHYLKFDQYLQSLNYTFISIYYDLRLR